MSTMSNIVDNIDQPLVFVAGTHGFDHAWHDIDGGMAALWASYGWDVLDRDMPFVWSTRLDGVWGASHTWQAAGYGLWYWSRAITYQRYGQIRPISVVAHSHGSQVALYAANYGMPIDLLVTMHSPVRMDMASIYKRARKNIKQWVHIYSRWDLWQMMGGLLDGCFGIVRKMSLADYNICAPRNGHTVALDPMAWKEQGWDQWIIARGHDDN